MATFVWFDSTMKSCILKWRSLCVYRKPMKVHGLQLGCPRKLKFIIFLEFWTPFSACWSLSPNRGATYRTDYAPLQACPDDETTDGFCTEKIRDCSTFHIDTPIVCLGPYNNIEIHGYLKSCDKNRMLWSRLASPDSNEWVISTGLVVKSVIRDK